MIRVHPHDQTSRINNIQELRDIFVDGVDYELNWLFLSTSGVHGTYQDLKDIERAILLGTICPDPETCECADCATMAITVLVVQPRRCNLMYGHIDILREDIPWLKEVVKKTIKGVLRSQADNIDDLVWIKTQ
jgi:hypothetical protein